nr:hypothetical protein BV181_01297 [Haemophilus influenzae]PRK49647.1 hypothetical protein BV182_00798 [Haemophilus influenzae]
MIFNPFIVFKSPVIFTLLEVFAVTLPEPLALVAFTSVRLPDAAPFNLASFALIAKVPLAALMLELVVVVKVPVVFNVTSVALMLPAISLLLAVRVVLPLFEVMLELAWVVKLSVAVTLTILPEIVPPIVPVALVILASPVFASIFEFALVIKSLVALTLTVLPEIVPSISPDWLEVVTLSVPLIVEPA